jgi:hypothetical protein
MGNIEGGWNIIIMGKYRYTVGKIPGSMKDKKDQEDRMCQKKDSL